MAVKVKVPFPDGPLKLTDWDGTEHDYTVTDGIVSAKDKAEAQSLVNQIAGASLASDKGSSSTT